MARLSRRSFLKVFGASALTGMAGSLGALGYATQIEPGWIEVTEQRLSLPRLDAAFDGYRVVQLSDIHIDGDFMDAARLDEVIRLANAQRPDLVVITGDFFTRQPAPFLELGSAALQRLEAVDGVVAVLGNHDYWGGAPDAIGAMLAASGVRLLRDAALTFQRQGAALHLAGLDDLWPDRHNRPALAPKAPLVQQLAASLPATGAAILLAHEPDIADWSAQTGRFDLQLSGHTHGGQVQVPFGSAPVVPPLGEKYVAGQYTVQQMLQYTSRGLGMVRPFVRFNCRPELAVFTLTGVS